MKPIVSSGVIPPVAAALFTEGGAAPVVGASCDRVRRDAKTIVVLKYWAVRRLGGLVLLWRPRAKFQYSLPFQWLKGRWVVYKCDDCLQVRLVNSILEFCVPKNEPIDAFSG